MNIRGNAPLLRAQRIAHDVLDGKLDELRALVAPALILSAHVRESSFDIGDLQPAQSILQIEVLRDERLDLLSDWRAIFPTSCARTLSRRFRFCTIPN